MIKKYKKLLTYVGIATIVAIIGFFGFSSVVKAIPPYFLQIDSTTTATSTRVFMSPGKATTTLEYDIYKLGGTSDTATDRNFALGIQVLATTTPFSLCWQTEYSNDYVDWYELGVALTTNATTTTQSRTYNENCWLFASSTPSSGFLGETASSTAHKIVNVPALLRYTRVNFYVPLTSSAAELWAEIIGVKER